MKTYVITTGVVFGLITIAHVLRMILERASLATDPAYLAITLVCAALCAWAFTVLRRAPAAGSSG